MKGLPTRLFLPLAALVFLVAGCSSGENNQTANYVGFDDAAPADTAQPVDSADAAPDAASADAPSADTASADAFADITDVFDSFLTLRAKAITGKIALDELESVATPKAIDQVLQLRTENDAKIATESYAALTELAEWSNVTAINQVGERMIFTDCTERQHVTPAGFTVISFVTNDVAVVDDDGQYKVDTVAVAQDGIVAVTNDAFGCVPPSFVERADRTARIAVDEAAHLIADPGAASDRELSAVFGGKARVNLQAALEALTRQGYSRVADETVTFDVIGMDVNRPEFTVVVAVCRTFTNGRPYVDRDGQEVVSDIPAGTSTEEWLYVNLEAVASGSETSDAVVAVEDRGLNCQKG